MEERGVVIEIKGRSAVIRAERSTACESCATRKACSRGEGDEMVIEADNPVGAHVGDRVLFESGAGAVLKAGIIFYLFPLIGFIAGVAVGQAWGEMLAPTTNRDLFSAVLGFAGVALVYGLIRVYGKLIERKGMRPVILSVVR
jgi:sigma-E factor negative regulatory protein RseC